jgi:hypothetical protein
MAKYEYHHHCCSCPYWLKVPFLMIILMWMKTLAVERDKNMCKRIDALIVEKHFTNNFGVKRIIIDQCFKCKGTSKLLLDRVGKLRMHYQHYSFIENRCMNYLIT